MFRISEVNVLDITFRIIVLDIRKAFRICYDASPKLINIARIDMDSYNIVRENLCENGFSDSRLTL